MKGFYVTGNKGTYVEIESGDYADSVSEAASLAGVEPHEAVELLADRIDQAADLPLLTGATVKELLLYVGA